MGAGRRVYNYTTYLMKSKNLYWTLSLIVIIISFGMIAIHWNDLPEQVPMHFDLEGTANRYGSKSELFILPIMSLGLWALFRWMSKKTLKINEHKYGVKTPVQLQVTKHFMGLMTLFTCVSLALGVYSILAIATGQDGAISYMMAFTGIGLIGLFVWYFVKLRRVSKKD